MLDMSNKNAFLTSRELREALQVSAKTVTRWKRMGCPHFCLGTPDGHGCRARFELSKVREWLEAQTTGNNLQKGK